MSYCCWKQKNIETKVIEKRTFVVGKGSNQDTKLEKTRLFEQNKQRTWWKRKTIINKENENRRRLWVSKSSIPLILL
jgi:hypothetical protein